MAYNAEDKITLEELSPSLQSLIKSATTKDKVAALNTRAEKLIALLSNARFSIVDSLSDIKTPENNRDIAVAGYGTRYALYFYSNNTWNKIPTASVDLNKEYLIAMTQSPHQRITATYNTVKYTSSFKAKTNGEVSVSILADSGYTAGKLKCPESFVVVGNTTVSAEEATLIPKYNIRVTPKAHQSIDVFYDGTTYSNTSISNIPDRSLYTVTVQPSYGWESGVLDISGDSLNVHDNAYMLIGDTTITVGQATRKNYTVTVPGTQNQEITFTYIDSNTGIEHTETISTLDRTFSIPYMSSFTASVNGTNGYLPGTLSNTSGDISTDLTITVSPAKKYYNKELFKTAGTTSWICPTFISKVHIIIAGAGGGAHSEEIEESSQRMVYINGGNGELIDEIIPINSGNTYELVVGKAGVTFESSGGFSSAFNIKAYGGSLDGTDAGNGKGGYGDVINYDTGDIISLAQDGHIILEYGTNIEEKEVTV